MSGLADSVIARIIEQRDLMQALDEYCKSVSARDKSVSQVLGEPLNPIRALVPAQSGRGHGGHN